MTGLALLVLNSGAAAAQLNVNVGAALGAGRIDRPYLSGCADSETRALGTQLYAGMGWRRLTATANYLQVGQLALGSDCTGVPLPLDGDRDVREVTRRSGSVWAWAVNLRYSPASVPLAGYVGVGRETEGNWFRTAGLLVRSGGSLRVLAGAELSQFGTPYVDVTQTWQDGQVEERVERGRGKDWRELILLKAGVEYVWSW